MLSLKIAGCYVPKVAHSELSRFGFSLCRRLNGTNCGEEPAVEVTPVESEKHVSNLVRSEKTINSVTLLGRIGNQPVQRGSEEHPVVTFSLATHSGYKFSNGDINQKTEWHRICVFKPGLRDSVYKFATKGQRVLIEGRIIYGEFKDAEGKMHTSTSIAADDVVQFKNN